VGAGEGARRRAAEEGRRRIISGPRGGATQRRRGPTDTPPHTNLINLYPGGMRRHRRLAPRKYKAQSGRRTWARVLGLSPHAPNVPAADCDLPLWIRPRKRLRCLLLLVLLVVPVFFCSEGLEEGRKYIF
jgi:hypothetical protein